MARFESIQDVVKDLCLRSGDLLQRNKGLYLNCAKDVWYDLNLTTVKIAKRELFQLNKRTNSISMPKSFLEISSVNVMDHRGQFYPVFMSDTVHDDIVDIGAAKNCNCEHRCGYILCNTIKGYEAVSSVKSDTLPNGTPISFNCIDRKAVDGQGFFYSETQYPKRIYTNGVWTNTVLFTEQKKLCKVEIDKNGCVCDTDSNIDTLCQACGMHETNTNLDQQCIPIGGSSNMPPTKNDDTWMYYVSTKLDWFSAQCGHHAHGIKKECFNVYNISEERDRVIFPPHFAFDKVMIRWYEDISLKDMMIPFLAKLTFMKGLQYFATTNNDKKVKESLVYERQYGSMKFGLLEEMNKYRLQELRMIMTPPVYVPSYIDHRRDKWGGWY